MMELLTVREVAAYLKTTRQQVRRMIQSGELRAIKVGREYRITLSALAEFLDIRYPDRRLEAIFPNLTYIRTDEAREAAGVPRPNDLPGQ